MTIGENMATAGAARAESDDQVRRIERQLAVVQQLTHIGSWEWDAKTNVVSWSDELYRIYGLEPQSCPITFESFLARLHPEDRAHVQAEVRGALARGGRFAYPERIVRPDGSIRELDTVGEAARDGAGNAVGLIGTCRDVTDERARSAKLKAAEAQARKLEASELRALEMIASGAELGEILRTLVLLIEEHAPPTIASILLLDTDGLSMRHGAAPNLPDDFNRCVDGQKIGPTAGSCGTAAFLRRAVIVTDIDVDPLWDGYRALAQKHGLRASWSTPIFATDGRVLGTFALYFRMPRAPTESDLKIIARVTHITGIAIERRLLENQLRELTAHVESVREDERTGIAREIHDELGQSLTALKMDLAWIRRRIEGAADVPRGAISEKIEAMSQMTDDVINQVRRISAELRPGVLDDLGLLAALEWQGQEFEKRTGIPCVITSNLGDVRLDRNLSTAVFRIFQEALTNIARHAEAKHVDVRLDRDATSLRLDVSDDGKGITPGEAHSPKALGLLGISERARRLGGTASITGVQASEDASANGGACDAKPSGTRVRLEVPMGST